MPRKVCLFAGLGWSTGKVHREVFSRIPDCEVFQHDPSNYIIHLLERDSNECDIIISTLNYHFACDRMFNTPELRRKVFLICHGTPELTQKDYSTDFRYGVTSEAILPVLAEKTNIRNPHVMPNGVDFSLYTHVERSGVLNVIGWAGAWQIPCKRCHMLQPIVNGTWMGVKATTSNPGLPEDKMDEWYRGIDILLVMSGPERWAETGPLTAFEAVACGAIVVGTNVGNSGRIPGPKFETVDEAIAIINDLKQHPEKVRDLTKEQYAYVKENFSYDVLAPMWEKALFGDDKFNGDA